MENVEKWFSPFSQTKRRYGKPPMNCGVSHENRAGFPQSTLRDRGRLPGDGIHPGSPGCMRKQQAFFPAKRSSILFSPQDWVFLLLYPKTLPENTTAFLPEGLEHHDASGTFSIYPWYVENLPFENQTISSGGFAVFHPHESNRFSLFWQWIY